MGIAGEVLNKIKKLVSSDSKEITHLFMEGVSSSVDRLSLDIKSIEKRLNKIEGVTNNLLDINLKLELSKLESVYKGLQESISVKTKDLEQRLLKLEGKL